MKIISFIKKVMNTNVIVLTAIPVFLILCTIISYFPQAPLFFQLFSPLTIHVVAESSPSLMFMNDVGEIWGNIHFFNIAVSVFYLLLLVGNMIAWRLMKKGNVRSYKIMIIAGYGIWALWLFPTLYTLNFISFIVFYIVFLYGIIRTSLLDNEKEEEKI